MAGPVYARRWSEASEEAFCGFLRDTHERAFGRHKLIQAASLAAMARLAAGQFGGEQTIGLGLCVDAQKPRPLHNVLLRASLPARKFLRDVSAMHLHVHRVEAVLARTETGAAADFDTSVGFLLDDGQVQPFDYQCGASESNAVILVAEALEALRGIDPRLEHAVPVLVNDRTLGLAITTLPVAAEHAVLIRSSQDDDCIIAGDHALSPGSQRGPRLISEFGYICVNGVLAESASTPHPHARRVIPLLVNQKMWQLLTPVAQVKPVGERASNAAYRHLELLNRTAGEIPPAWSEDFVNTTISSRHKLAVEVRERFMATHGLALLWELVARSGPSMEVSDLVP